MDNTIQALQNLYVALGGDLSDVADIVIIPDMINAIAAVIPSAIASALPEVSTSDNGKVLKVADGEWSVGTDAT